MSHFLFTNLMRSGTLDLLPLELILSLCSSTSKPLKMELLFTYIFISWENIWNIVRVCLVDWRQIITSSDCHQVIYFFLWSCYNSELINSKRFLFHFKSVIWINNYNFDVLYIIWWKRSDQYKWTLSSLNRSNFSVFNLCF